MLALLVLVQTNAALWAHMVTTTDSGQSVVAIGLRDMIAMQHGADAPMAAIVLGGATVALAAFILVLVTVLYLRSAKREHLRAQRLVAIAAGELPRTLAGRYYKALKSKLTRRGQGGRDLRGVVHIQDEGHRLPTSLRYLITQRVKPCDAPR